MKVAAYTVEFFFLQNACLDAGLLWLVAAWQGSRIRPVRIALGAMLGGLYAVIAAGSGGAMRSFPALLCASLAMVLVAGERPIRPARVLLSMCVLWGGSLLLGGATTMGIGALPAGIITGLCGMALLRRKNAPPPPVVRLVIEKDGSCFAMDAIVDTGNRALDPLLSLPVVFIRQGDVRTTMDRKIYIRTAAGAQMVRGFVPDRLTVDGREQRAVVACCEEGSLGSALVPLALCAERKSA